MKFSIYSRLFRSLCSISQLKTIIFGFAVLAAILSVFATYGQAASPGALDLTFGVRGTAAAVPTTNTFREERAIAIQPDGKVVLVGFVINCVVAQCSSNIAVVRFNTDGTLDNSFDSDGMVITDFFGQDEIANAVAVQADGKIVVAGGLFDVSNGTNVLGFKLVRYNVDGSLDTTFGTGGRVYESFDDVGGTAETMIIQPDGKIVVAGTDDNLMLFVARFNANGSLDTGFGTNGRFASNAYNVYEVKLARQADGKIIIAASSTPFGTLKLIRFNADGTLDTNFGTGGTVTSNFTLDFTPSVAVQTDGKILVSGAYTSSNDVGTPPLKRFNTDGSVDTSFVPNHGELVAGICRTCTRKPVKILSLPDGRFYLAGYYPGVNNASLILSVSRYLSNGTIDPSFGFRGTSFFRHTNSPFGSNTNLLRVNDAALQADGKIVMAATGNLPYQNFNETNYLAIRINAAVTPPSMRGDFDGDRKTDFAVFRPSSRYWYVLNSGGSTYFERYGADGDILTPGDYNYDLKTDLAVFRPGNNAWYISPSLPSGGGVGSGAFGQTGDINVPEDYNGDGYTDLAVFRPSNGTWNIRYSLIPTYPFGTPFVYEVSFPFGTSTDKPVPADYDGDGRADIAVFRPSNGVWYIWRSSDNVLTAVQFGIASDKTVQGDYDGDLKADVAVFRDGNWYILRSSDGGFVGVGWGFASDKPVPGDYDSDGKFDVAVFRPNDGAWYVLRSSNSSFIGQQWGISEDIPIPFTFVR